MADPMVIEQTQWPAWIALHSGQLLRQMEKGMSISPDSVDCVDIAIELLQEAKEIIVQRRIRG